MVCDGPAQPARTAASSAREAFLRTNRIRIAGSPSSTNQTRRLTLAGRRQERAVRVRTSTFGRAVIVAGGLLLSACGGARQVALPVDAGSQLRPDATGHASWMSPAAKTVSLVVYVADGQEVDAYAYKTHALLGQLAIEGANTLCSDKSGNI